MAGNPITSAMAGPLGNILGGVGGLAAGLLGSGPTTTTTNGTTNTQGETNTSASSNQSFQQMLSNLLSSLQSTSGGTTSTQSLSPQGQQLIDSLTSKYQSLTAPSLTGYSAQQTQGINNNANIQSQAVNNIMASRGLATSPAAATAQSGVEAQRVGAITGMQEQLPVLQNQMNLSNLGAAGQFANTLPRTTTTANNQNTTGTQQQTQNTGGQSWANQFGYQGTNQSQNVNQTQTSQQQGSASAGIAGLLAGLFSDERLKESIEEIPSEKAAARILALRPVSWKWRGSDTEDSGLLAQDLQRVLPELVEKDPEGSGFLKVNYAGLIGELVGALQHVNSKVEAVI